METTLLYQPIARQATIGSSVRLEGRAAFHPGDGIVELSPAPPGTGLRLRWRGETFPLVADYISPTPFRTTALSPDGAAGTGSDKIVYTTEHLLSAIYGLGLDNCIISIGDNGLIPFFDGSAHEFCNALLNAGITAQEKHYRRVVMIQRKLRIEKGDAFIEISPPSTAGLRITAAIALPDPIGEQAIEYAHSPLSYCLNIAWARTFATRDFVSEDLTRMDLPGFRIESDNSVIKTPMLVFKEGKYITTVRRHDEPVRHKVLDFIGDMGLLGADLHADVLLRKSGHGLNRQLVTELRALWLTESEMLKVEPGEDVKPKFDGDNSRFVRDVTLVDGELYRPLERLVKTWEIMNAGSVPWVGRSLVRVGPCDGYGIISSKRTISIPTTAAGESVQISVEIETPRVQGHYIAQWKMVDANGDFVFPNRDGLFVILRV